MGFRVDGCGTYSANNKLKHVGDYWCDTCKEVHPFSLYELTEKITVLFIPVAKLSTRYAVLCEKCKRGYKITDEQKFQLMSGDTGVLSQFFAAEEVEEMQEQKREVLPAPKIAQNTVPNRGGCCPRCGTPVDKSALFCSRCGLKYSTEEMSAALHNETKEPRICSQCGSAVPDGMLFCTQCGNKLN